MLIALREEDTCKGVCNDNRYAFALITPGACSREEPQTKVLPATMISPAFTLGEKLYQYLPSHVQPIRSNQQLPSNELE